MGLAAVVSFVVLGRVARDEVMFTAGFFSFSFFFDRAIASFACCVREGGREGGD